MSKTLGKRLRRAVYHQSDGRCIYCKRVVHPHSYSIEHYIIPRCCKPCDELWNLRTSCTKCNNDRGALLQYNDLYRTKRKWIDKHIKVSQNLEEKIWEEFYQEWLELIEMKYDVVGHLLAVYP